MQYARTLLLLHWVVVYNEVYETCFRLWQGFWDCDMIHETYFRLWQDSWLTLETMIRFIRHTIYCDKVCETYFRLWQGLWDILYIAMRHTFWASFSIFLLLPPNLPRTRKATWATLSGGFRRQCHSACNDTDMTVTWHMTNTHDRHLMPDPSWHDSTNYFNYVIRNLLLIIFPTWWTRTWDLISS